LKQNRFMGIDIGSENSKGVILENDNVIAKYLCKSGSNYRKTAEKIKDTLLSDTDLSIENITYTVATGCGSPNVYFADEKVADLLCSARGSVKIIASATRIFEIGARSSRAIEIDSKTKKIINFSVTDKCAAGSYYFIQVVAKVLGINLDEIASTSLKSKQPISFNTGCAVFGETEAITRVVEGVAKEDILAGAHNALADKLLSLYPKFTSKGEFAIIGGGAIDRGLVESIKRKASVNIIIPSNPIIVPAVGAAIFAREKFLNAI